MPKKKRLGHGIKVKVGTLFVGFVKSFKPADITREMVNVTDMESVAEDFLDSDPPMIGQITCSATWDPDDSTGDGAIETLLLNDAIDEREIDMEFQYRASSTGTPPAASVWTYKYVRYTGRLVSIAPAEVTSKGEMLYTITFQPTALPVRGTVS
jgi:hypothetical protein